MVTKLYGTKCSEHKIGSTQPSVTRDILFKSSNFVAIDNHKRSMNIFSTLLRFIKDITGKWESVIQAQVC